VHGDGETVPGEVAGQIPAASNVARTFTESMCDRTRFVCARRWKYECSPMMFE